MRKLFEAVIVALGLLVAGAASAEEALELYQGRATVTGTREETRAVGFAAAFEEVLAKVSGDARLIGDSRVAALAGNAAEYVASYTYRDRMEGIPAHDDQGSYDRPHDLTVTFDKGKIDGALASLGLKPWTEARPPIVLFVGVRNGDVAFVLSADAEQGASMREALAAAAVRTGLPASVPSRSALDEAGLTVATLPAADPAMLDEIARSAGGRGLAGSLTFSVEAAGWIVEWRFADQGKIYAWQRRGVSFDEAFRSGLRGVAQVLSGHGPPE